MKKMTAGLISGVVFGLMIVGGAVASEHEGYESHRGYYGNGYGYDNDDMYRYGRVVYPSPYTTSYNNIVPTIPSTVYTNPTYPIAMPYYGNHEGREMYEHGGRYGYDNDDMYRGRGGYEYHD